jgi:uncharacterized protein (TIGR02145 family)
MAFYSDEFDSTDIEVRQLNYHTAVDVDAAYALNSDYTQTFTVWSNTEWAVKPLSLQDPEVIVHELNPSGGYDATGEKAPFKLVSNEAKDGKTATFTLYDPDGLAGDVTVTITATGCGINAIPVTKHIGNGNYLTHAYAGKCWMVQLSKEGTFSGKSFGYGTSGTIGNLNNKYGNFTAYLGMGDGYYYTWQQANATNNACPSGWHLPEYAEIAVLKPLVEADISGIGKWWGGTGEDARKGYIGLYNPAQGIWYDWNWYLRLWAKAEHYYWWGGGQGGKIELPSRLYEDAQHWFSVRCVQN